MHEHNVAHRSDCSEGSLCFRHWLDARDACFFNFMVDATKLSPRGFHYCNPSTYDGVHYIPRYRTRKSVGPMKYYWVDFGLSIHFPSLEHRQLVYGRVGQERNVPEMSQDAFYDAFKADVFQVGMTMKRLCEVKETFAYLSRHIYHCCHDSIMKDLSSFNHSLIDSFRQIQNNVLLRQKHCWNSNRLSTRWSMASSMGLL